MTATNGIRRVWNSAQFILSDNDDRAYKGIELDNGLRALLISDAHADRAAAALDVHVGSCENPANLPGLAHFLEHMLFMGTKSFPEEDDYMNYIAENGGSRNAYTSSEHTNYYFEVIPDAFDGALERFSKFFHEPLMNEDSTEREVKAIDHEMDKNYKNDSRRQHQILKSLADKGSNYTGFGCGNLKTLWTVPKEQDIDTRTALWDFYNKRYCAGIMQLCVLSNKSLDVMEASVVNLFSMIENKGCKRIEYPQQFTSNLAKVVYIIPVMETRSLRIHFTTPDFSLHDPTYRSLLGHLIGHEGPGSLLSELKRSDWANRLSAGCGAHLTGSGLFNIQISLTVRGMAEYQKVVHAVFQYITLLKNSLPLESWRWDEQRQLKANAFKFRQKDSGFGRYVTSMASNMQKSQFENDLHEILRGRYIVGDYNPEKLAEHLSFLRPDNCHVILSASEFEKNWPTEAGEKLNEQWHDATYGVRDFTVEEVAMWSEPAANVNLKLPGRNEFIASSFEIAVVDKSSHPTGIFGESVNRPQLVVNEPGMRVFWKPDDGTYNVPKAYYTVHLSKAQQVANPLDRIKQSIAFRLLLDSLNEAVYDAELAGLHCTVANFNTEIACFEIRVHGYTEKLAQFLKFILDYTVTFKADPVRFDAVKEQLRRGYANFKSRVASSQATTWLDAELKEFGHLLTPDKFIQAFEDHDELITCDAVQNVYDNFFKGKDMSCEILMTGSVPKSATANVHQTVGDWLDRQKVVPRIKNEIVPARYCILPKGQYRIIHRNEVQPNGAIMFYIPVGDMEIERLVLTQLFLQIARSPTFDTLRTKLQLGYAVGARLSPFGPGHGMCFYVQSSKHTMYLELKIRAFIKEKLTEFMTDICTNPDSQQKYKDFLKSFIEKILIKPKNLSEDDRRVFGEISKNRYNFEYTQEKAETSKKQCTPENLLNFFNKTVRNFDTAVAVHVLGKDMQTSMFETVEDYYKAFTESDEDFQPGNLTAVEKESLSEMVDASSGVPVTDAFYPARVPNQRDSEVLGF